MIEGASLRADLNGGHAAVFEAPGQPLELRRFPAPRLEPGEVLVRVRACTLCRSDIHTYQARRETPTPTVLGHEIIGDIVDLGPDGKASTLEGGTLEVGDRITWTIIAHCGGCFYCDHGLPQKCDELFKYGHHRIEESHPFVGGLAEYCHLRRGTAILKIPEELADAVACPANCATATMAAAMRLLDGCRDETVLIQGAGMLGLTGCAMARSLGAAEVIVCDIDESRLQLATQFGATACVKSVKDSDALAGMVDERTSGRGVDLAIDLSGDNDAIESGLERLRTGGRYLLVGSVVPTRPLSLAAESIVRRMLSIRGLHNYAPQDLQTGLDFLARSHSQYPFAEAVSATFDLQDVEKAFDFAIQHHPLRVMVRP